ncbi:MAG: uL15 family ribosomal protein [Acidilobus sp.]
MTWTIPRARKKVRKLRGRTRTMGWGRIGQHRKSGSRGGRGAAGMGKHKKSWMLKYAPHWLGKRGFKNPTSRGEPKAIDLEELERLVKELAKGGQVKVENDTYVVNLSELGYEKLLGSGKVSIKVKVVVPEATQKAVEKIKAAGGEVVVEGQAEQGSS